MFRTLSDKFWDTTFDVLFYVAGKGRKVLRRLERERSRG